MTRGLTPTPPVDVLGGIRKLEAAHFIISNAHTSERLRRTSCSLKEEMYEVQGEANSRRSLVVSTATGDLVRLAVDVTFGVDRLLFGAVCSCFIYGGLQCRPHEV